jgi:hypothetical protein
MTYEQVVSRFKNVKHGFDGRVSAQCPAHGDRQNSLSATSVDGKVLLRCHAGCTVNAICEAIGLSLSDLFAQPRNGYQQSQGATNGHVPSSALTLKEFAAAKGFDLDFLSMCGVSEGRGGLVFTYLLKSGQRAARQRIRTSLQGEKKFLWNKAEGRPVPYGLERIDKADAEELHLVEGESDALTCWSHCLYALGIPGASQCELLHLPHVAKF